MEQEHDKQIKGHLNIDISIPIAFNVKAKFEEYIDGKYEEYEYNVDEILDQFPQYKEIIEKLKAKGFAIDQIEIEEC